MRTWSQLIGITIIYLAIFTVGSSVPARAASGTLMRTGMPYTLTGTIYLSPAANTPVSPRPRLLQAALGLSEPPLAVSEIMNIKEDYLVGAQPGASSTEKPQMLSFMILFQGATSINVDAFTRLVGDYQEVAIEGNYTPYASGPWRLDILSVNRIKVRGHVVPETLPLSPVRLKAIATSALLARLPELAPGEVAQSITGELARGLTVELSAHFESGKTRKFTYDVVTGELK
jgi:hypothetical protein